jgi:hypothetical protein
MGKPEGAGHPVEGERGSAEAALYRVADLGRELGSEHVSEEAAELAERMAEGRFYVACIGQFKRGKSTLLDALVGDRVLPTGILPVTAVPTIVRHGAAKSARVRFQGGTWIDVATEELRQYVSEEGNPENAKNVAGVEVFVPSSLLEGGMCLVDTPGLGSVFAGNTAATRAFLPHIDAAIVVVGADPPIAGEELKLVEQAGKQIRDLVVVLNKADKASDAERHTARAFTHKVLEKRLGRAVGTIYDVSAEERLEGRGPERDWPALVEALQELARESGSSLVRKAGERGLRRLSEELFTIVSDEREALLRPIEESERRIQDLRQTIGEAERSLRDLGYLFTAEQHHLSDALLERRKKFLAGAMPEASAEFAAQLARLPRRFGPKFRRDAMAAANEIAERHMLPWLRAEQAGAEEEYRKVASRFVEIANGFLTKLSEAGVPELARMPNALDAERGFRVPSRYRFEDLLTIARPASPLRFLADVFLGFAGASSVIARDAKEFLDHLMETNSARVQSDVMGRVQESRGQLEVEIRKLLHEVSRMAERALDHARVARAEGAAAVDAALARLVAIESELRAVGAAVAESVE